MPIIIGGGGSSGGGGGDWTTITGKPTIVTTIGDPGSDSNLVSEQAVREAVDAVSGAGVTDGDKGDITVSASGATWTIDANVVSDAKLRQSAALSVIGRSANSTGDVADITAANDAEVLRRSGTSVGFGTVATAGIADSAVTLAKIQDISTSRVLGRVGEGTGIVEQVTVTPIIDTPGVDTKIPTEKAVRDAISAIGSLSDGDKGDITVSSSGTVWSVDTGVITTTKMGGDVTTAGKALLTAADAAAQLTALELSESDGIVWVQLTPFLATQSVEVVDFAGDVWVSIPESLNGYNLHRAIVEHVTAGVTGVSTYQIRNVTQTVDMLSTAITVDSSELSSRTAATPLVIDTANDDVATGDIIVVDVDGVSTTAPIGLAVLLGFKAP